MSDHILIFGGGLLIGLLVTSVVAIVHFHRASRKMFDAGVRRGIRSEKERQRWWNERVLHPTIGGRN